MRNDSAVNSIALKIPGWDEALTIPFPHGRLPVCGKCKLHFKTRDLCRAKKKHTDLPWNIVYICIILDDSCTDENNELRKGPYEAINIDWQPCEFKNPTSITKDIPMCLDCKNKNYTRSFCRGGGIKHLQLPWSTVYTKVSCLNHFKTTTEKISTKKAKIKKPEEKERNPERMEDEQSKTNSLYPDRFSDDQKHDPDDINFGKRKITYDNQKKKKPKVNSGDEEEERNMIDDRAEDGKNVGEGFDDTFIGDMTKIEDSRAFFVQISQDVCSLKWLNFDKEKLMSHAVHSSTRHNKIQSEKTFAFAESKNLSNPEGHFDQFQGWKHHHNPCYQPYGYGVYHQFPNDMNHMRAPHDRYHNYNNSRYIYRPSALQNSIIPDPLNATDFMNQPSHKRMHQNHRWFSTYSSQSSLEEYECAPEDYQYRRRFPQYHDNMKLTMNRRTDAETFDHEEERSLTSNQYHQFYTHSPSQKSDPFNQSIKGNGIQQHISQCDQDEFLIHKRNEAEGRSLVSNQYSQCHRHLPLQNSDPYNQSQKYCSIQKRISQCDYDEYLKKNF